MSAALSYHQATRHSPASVRASQHQLDWANQPLPYKRYTALDAIALPREDDRSARPPGAQGGSAEAPLDLSPAPGRIDRATLATLLRYSNGIVRVLRRRGFEMPFRAAACTGALFHIEAYLVCGDLPDAQLGAGVYHYDVPAHALRPLRRAESRSILAEASGAEPGSAFAPLSVVLTSTFWRNAWKYQARAYRHSFWDSGTVLANLFELADALDLDARLLIGFADPLVNQLLDVDPAHEAAVALVNLTPRGAAQPTLGGARLASASIEPLHAPTQRLSAFELAYPAITQMHAASSLASGAAVAAWRASTPEANRGSADLDATGRLGGVGAGGGADRRAPGAWPDGERQAGAAQGGDVSSSDRLAELLRVIRRRGSSRRFGPSPIGLEQVRRLLAFATRPIPSDIAGAGPLTTPVLIVNAVDGLQPGTYRFHRRDGGLELLSPGLLRDLAGHLALDQALAADAAVNVYSLADLDRVVDRFGDRGYRAAQLEAAIEGGRLYLQAYAEGLGATGLTFYDDEVARVFGHDPTTTGVMFLTAIGHPAPRATTARS